MQNLAAPGSSRYGELVRSCFEPDPGFEMGYADLKGAEFLVVAELTQDPLMLKYAQMSIDGTGDVHRETAAFVFSRIEGIPYKPEDIAKDSPKRFLGKKTRHSANYMVGWHELMTRINAEALETGIFVTAREMKLILGAYHLLHPGLRQWWNEEELEVRQTGMSRNLFGFPRRFYGHVSQQLPAIVAFKPQSTVGDTLNFGLVACHNDPELADAGYQDLANVHDAILFQYPIGQRDAVIPRVRKLMDIPIRIPKTGKDLHIPVEIAIGPNWGQLEVVK
jgi:DNA polymerase I-like protein with 3'-5' exonuclease and polymerase domains